ncbi:hypothetical protein OIU76_022642 [Salix suchowensis]|nr:hypothetical protein OIU76_022642 [Salix suchowensis]
MDAEPNAATFVSVLVACGRKGYLSLGKGIHRLIIERGFGLGSEVSNALMDMYVKCESLLAMVDMYAKCGCIEMAMQTFNEMPRNNVLTWNATQNGLAMHGHGQKKYNLPPRLELYGCMVDLLCRAGLLDEALELTKAMPCYLMFG